MIHNTFLSPPPSSPYSCPCNCFVDCIVDSPISVFVSIFLLLRLTFCLFILSSKAFSSSLLFSVFVWIFGVCPLFSMITNTHDVQLLCPVCRSRCHASGRPKKILFRPIVRNPHLMVSPVPMFSSSLPTSCFFYVFDKENFATHVCESVGCTRERREQSEL